MRNKLEEAGKLREKVHPDSWGFGGNYPFYVDMSKPRPSMSKHDNERPTYWHYDDASYLLLCLSIVEEMLKNERA